jgi:hypothetical protein
MSKLTRILAPLLVPLYLISNQGFAGRTFTSEEVELALLEERDKPKPAYKIDVVFNIDLTKNSQFVLAKSNIVPVSNKPTELVYPNSEITQFNEKYTIDGVEVSKMTYALSELEIDSTPRISLNERNFLDDTIKGLETQIKRADNNLVKPTEYSIESRLKPLFYPLRFFGEPKLDLKKATFSLFRQF